MAWNDYATALYEVSLEQDAPRSAAAALAALDRALALEPRSPEALFNRATVLHDLGLTAAAASAWEAFLDVESSTEWSAEARAILNTDRRMSDSERWKQSKDELLAASRRGDARTVTALVRALPQNARTSAEYDLLNAWAQAWADGRLDEASQSLQAAEMVGTALFELHGETLVREAAASGRRASEGGPRLAAELARAQREYEQARSLVRDRKPSQAAPLLESAERGFSAATSPMALVARYYRAEALFDLRNLDDAVALLDSIDAELQPGYHALRGNTLLARTRVEGRTGRLSAALTHAMEAAALFERQEERDACARARNEVAALLSALGRPEEAWRVRRLLFADASHSGSRTLGTALYTAAKDEVLLDRLDIGRSFFDLALQQPNLVPLIRFDAMLWRAFATTRLEDGRVEDDLAGAAVQAQSIGDPALREEALDQLRLVEAMGSQATDAPRALRLLEECIGFREKAQRLSRLAEAHSVRGQVLRSAGEVDRAVNAFDTALSILEEQRRDVGTLLLRDSFFATAEETCRELVEIEVARQDGERAFAVAERCRARTIVDTLGDGTPERARSLDEVQQALPADVLMLHYTALPARTLALAVTRERRTAAVVGVPAAMLAAHVARLQAAIEHDDSRATTEASAALYRALVAPFSAELEGKRVVIVPDGPIADVPFAVLGNSGEQPLVTRAEILYSPSASAYVASALAPLDVRRALIVGDPATTDRSLAPLPGAFREAVTVARLYSGATLLTREQASAANVLDAATNSDVIHIAAHAVVNPYDALRSALRLAPFGTDDGTATVEMIATRTLPRAPVVVLAGCSTGVRGEGRGAIRSLGLAFLAAGSRSVVSTLWDLPDRKSSRFAHAFHQHLLAGGSASLALRTTQLQWIRSPNPEDRLPSSWAAYQVLGQH